MLSTDGEGKSLCKIRVQITIHRHFYYLDVVIAHFPHLLHKLLQIRALKTSYYTRTLIKG